MLFEENPVDQMAKLNDAMKLCTACHLSLDRTQVVTGEGDPTAKVMLVGHGPSGTDDQTGRPYTGPGGVLLDELFAQAGISRSQVYVTNLTKCWAWKEQFGRRVNRTPSNKEIRICAPLWFFHEYEIVRPEAIVCFGVTTAQYFLGKDFKITEQDGQWLKLPTDSPAAKLLAPLIDRFPQVMAIPQPAYLIHLEQHSPDTLPAAREKLLADLAKVRAAIDGRMHCY